MSNNFCRSSGHLAHLHRLGDLLVGRVGAKLVLQVSVEQDPVSVQNFLADFRLLRRDVLRIEADLDSHERSQEGVETVVAVDVSGVSTRQSPTFQPVEFVFGVMLEKLSRARYQLDSYSGGCTCSGITIRWLDIGSVLLKVTWLVATI